MTEFHADELCTRFHDIIDTNAPENQRTITICGLGSIGSHLTLLLARMGFQKLVIYDYDKVENLNIGYQNFRLQDLGKSKAQATAEIVKENTGLDIEWHNEKIEDASKIETEILVCGVDDMDVRKDLAENATYESAIDVRMGAEEITVYAWNELDKDRYMEYWFPAEEANELPCGGKAIGYTCLLSAGFAGNLVKRLVLGEKVPFEQIYIATIPHYEVTE